MLDVVNATLNMTVKPQKKPSVQFYLLTVIHTYTDAPTHTHSHSHKRMRHISPQLLCWIHPNMVGDISMATAGRRGADLYGMISRESLLFDFWFKLFCFNSFSTIVVSTALTENLPLMKTTTDNPTLVTYWLPWQCDYTTCSWQTVRFAKLAYIGFNLLVVDFVLSSQCCGSLWVHTQCREC